MRQQAMENLLALMEKEINKLGKPPHYKLVDIYPVLSNLRNLSAKSQILRSRNNDEAVIKELYNADP